MCLQFPNLQDVLLLTFSFVLLQQLYCVRYEGFIEKMCLEVHHFDNYRRAKGIEWLNKLLHITIFLLITDKVKVKVKI